MANLANIARPYALATFEYAREKQVLPVWKAFLQTAAMMSQQADVAKLLANPEVLPTQLFELFSGVLSAQLTSEQKNFLLLLAQNKRLNVLPAISDTFNAYYAALEKTSSVRVITAIDAKEDFQEKLAKALSKRIQRDVTLKCEIDPSILGGAIIHIGDNVIDGSIRGKLSRLLQNLTS